MTLRWTEEEFAEFQRRRGRQLQAGPFPVLAAKAGSTYQVTRSKKRPDLGNRFFRSGWEANYARYLNFCGVKWAYEARTFAFPGIKRGVIDYTPDFYLPEEDRWVEVKGWFSPRDMTKIRRFARFYPEEFAKLTVLTRDSGKALEAAQKLGVPRIESYSELARAARPYIPLWE